MSLKGDTLKAIKKNKFMYCIHKIIEKFKRKTSVQIIKVALLSPTDIMLYYCIIVSVGARLI